MTREIRFYENYFIEFYLSLGISVQEKIEYVFKVIRTVDRVPEKFLKHIESTDGLYEIRVKVGSDASHLKRSMEALLLKILHLK